MEYKILKVKSTDETKNIRCNFYNRGFCKAPDSMFDHPDEDCESHLMGNCCKNIMFNKRHRMICKYIDSESGCTRGSECMFLHNNRREKNQEILKLLPN